MSKAKQNLQLGLGAAEGYEACREIVWLVCLQRHATVRPDTVTGRWLDGWPS